LFCFEWQRAILPVKLFCFDKDFSFFKVYVLDSKFCDFGNGQSLINKQTDNDSVPVVKAMFAFTQGSSFQKMLQSLFAVKGIYPDLFVDFVLQVQFAARMVFAFAGFKQIIEVDFYGIKTVFQGFGMQVAVFTQVFKILQNIPVAGFFRFTGKIIRKTLNVVKIAV